MKKIFGLLVVLFAVVTLSACSSSSSSNLNGTWYEYFKAGDGTMQIVEADYYDIDSLFFLMLIPRHLQK